MVNWLLNWLPLAKLVKLPETAFWVVYWKFKTLYYSNSKFELNFRLIVFGSTLVVYVFVMFEGSNSGEGGSLKSPFR